MIKKHYQKGSATMLAIGVLMFVTIIMGGLIPLVNTQVSLTTMNQDVLEAQYAAEAGAKRALVGLMQSRIDWAWANGTAHTAFINDVMQKYYIVSISPAITDGASPAPGTLYKITADGYVGKAHKRVTVTATTATVGGSSSAVGGNSFNNAMFSGGSLEVDGQSSSGPTIKGSLGSNGAVIINSYDGKQLNIGQLNTYSTPNSSNSSWGYYGYNNNSTNWYVKSSTPEIFNTSFSTSFTIPTMPANAPSNPVMPTTSGDQYWNASTTLAASSYYYPRSYSQSGTWQNNYSVLTMSNTSNNVEIYINGALTLYIAKITGNKIDLYINGNFQLNNSSIIVSNATHDSQLNIYATGSVDLTGTSSIIGDNVNIYSGGTVVIDSTSSITASNTAKNGQLNIYSKGTIHFTTNAVVNGDYITIVCNDSSNSLNGPSSVLFDNNTSVNKNSATSMVKIYSQGNVYFDGNVAIGGGANLVVTNGTVKADGQVSAATTVLVANNTNQLSYVTGTVTLAGVYTSGNLKIDGTPIINYNSTVMQSLGITSTSGTGSGTSIPFSIGSWSSQ